MKTQALPAVSRVALALVWLHAGCSDRSPVSPSRNVAGMYTLTIAAAEECRQNPDEPLSGPQPLPDEVMTRTYVATISQTRRSLSVQLSGATFAPEGFGTLVTANSFHGDLEPDRAVFLLGKFEPWWSGGDVVEHIGPERFLAIDGQAIVELPTTRVTGTLSGSFKLLTSNPWVTDSPVTLGECFSNRHRFTLSR